MNESRSVDIWLPQPVQGADVIAAHRRLVTAAPLALPIERRHDKTVIIGQVSARLPYLDLAVEPLRDGEMFGPLCGFNPTQNYEGFTVMTWDWKQGDQKSSGAQDQSLIERTIEARADVLSNMLG